jgi:hypothetical protein
LIVERKISSDPETSEYGYTILLEGILSANIGSNPSLKLSASLNGTAGPSFTDDLCSGGILEVRQSGQISCPPNEGRVEMSWAKRIAPTWIKTGFYEIRVDMYTTNGSIMTSFEATLWVEGYDVEA